MGVSLLADDRSVGVCVTPRLFVDGRRLEPPRTGVGTYLLALVEHWSRDPDHIGEVTLLTREADSVPSGVDLPVRPLGKGPWWHVRAARLVRRHRARYFSPESLIVPVLVGAGATVTIHDLTALLMPGAHVVRTRLANRLLLGLAVRRAGRLITPSAATATDLHRLFPRSVGKTTVVHHGPRRLPVVEPTTGREPMVLHVGTIEPRKNVDALVEAFRRATPEGWRLVLVGRWGWVPDGERRRLEAAIAGDPRVERVGFVDDGELASLYRRASIFAYPSSYEGFGLPVLEAMAHGVPVITTTAPALAEVAGGAARLVDPAHLDRELVAALEELCDDPAARDQLSARSRERAEHFMLEAYEERTLAVCLG